MSLFGSNKTKDRAESPNAPHGCKIYRHEFMGMEFAFNIPVSG